MNYYLLEIIHVNQKENLFFQDTDIEKKASIDFFNAAVDKHIQTKDLFDFSKQRKRLQRHNGDWQLTTTIEKFKSIESAENLFTELTADGSNYRAVRRAWHNEHNIFAEANILTPDKNIVKTIHSCQGNTCVRFGTCNAATIDGCSIVNHTETKFPIIYHIKSI